MIRAVLDVNVLVSGFPSSTGVPGVLIEYWLRKEFELVISEHILEGMSRAWNRDYFRFRFRQEAARAAENLLRTRAMVVEPVHSVHDVADDEEDDLVLATAIAGNATHLVTGDKGLLRLGEYKAIAILSPRSFLTLLADRADSFE